MRRIHAASIAIAAFATLSILLLQPLLVHVQHAPDQGAAWYYWKRTDPNVVSRLTAWGAYIAHQLFFWGLIWWAKRHRNSMTDRGQMHPVNWIGLAGTAFFVGLHYLQTAIWYDGLAQDVSVFSSQGSVILMLVVVLVMEAPRRGLFFGYGGRRLGGIRTALIRYHGYYFAWAITYTYWFHPMETTPGHLLGFFYTFLLMIQGAFVFTRVHTNRWWTVSLEVLVLVHGVVVALVAGQELWPMFLFGFAAMFVITQMHGLGLSRTARMLVTAVFVFGVVWVYSGRDIVSLNEVFRIPLIDYALVGLVSALVWLLVTAAKKRDNSA